MSTLGVLPVVEHLHTHQHWASKYTGVQTIILDKIVDPISVAVMHKLELILTHMLCCIVVTLQSY